MPAARGGPWGAARCGELGGIADADTALLTHRQRLSLDGVGHGEAPEAVHLLTGWCRRGAWLSPRTSPGAAELAMGRREGAWESVGVQAAPILAGAL